MTKRPTLAAALALAVTFGIGAAIAQTAHQGHEGHSMASSDNPSTAAFMAANDKMHQGMGIDFTGDPDVDFIRGMIPHHEGAVDMARIVLEHGKDPEVRKLAEAIIAAQEVEIAWMKDWLTKNGH